MGERTSAVPQSVIAHRRASWRATLDSGLLKNTLALISGTVVTQAIVFLASPILARVFTPEAFGDLANFNAWVAILTLLSNLRYEHAIIVAKGRKHVSRVVALAGVLSLASLIVYGLFAAGFYFFYGGAGYLGHLRRIVFLIPIGTLAVCFTSILIQVNVRTGHFKRIASVSATQIVFTLVPQLVLGRLHVAHALIIGTVAGYCFAGAVFLWFFIRDGEARRLRAGVGAIPLWETARRHRNFPRYTLPADAITILSQQFVPVFVLALFNPAVAGLYAFSVRAVRLPLIVVSTALAGALRKEAIDRVHSGRSLASLFTVTTRSLAVLSLAPFVTVLLFAEPIFATVFGQRWAEAGRVVQILSPGILLEFVSLPLAVFFLVTNTQRYTLAIQLSGFVLFVVALLVGRNYFGDFMTTCYLLSAVMVVVNLASIVMAGRVTGLTSLPAPVEVT
jgi:O-antigen/teichoic acid export membrane protein